MKSRLNFIDLFSGAGGLMLGFIKAGYVPLLSVENWEPAIKTHIRNYKGVPLIKKDIRTITKRDLYEIIGNKNVDVVIGGPPCQGFSTIGKRLSEDPRNRLIFEFIRIVKIIRPKYFLMENVRGLAAKKNNMIQVIKKEFDLIGYKNVISEVLCAADYGVPQKRYRVFFLGTTAKKAINFPSKIYTKESYKTVGNAIMDLVGKELTVQNHIPMKHNLTVRGRIMHIPEGHGLPKNIPEEFIFGSRSDYKKNRLKNFSHVYRRLHRNLAATTMVPGHNAFPLHPTEHRSLTVREAARIQTFPDEVVFEGSRQEQCIQVGNAVPVELASVLAKHLRHLIRG